MELEVEGHFKTGKTQKNFPGRLIPDQAGSLARQNWCHWQLGYVQPTKNEAWKEVVKF